MSDHAAIELTFRWPKMINTVKKPINYTKWNNTNENQICQWKNRWNERSLNINLKNEYKHEEFHKEFSLMAKEMRKITRKIFGNTQRRTKMRKKTTCLVPSHVKH